MPSIYESFNTESLNERAPHFKYQNDSYDIYIYFSLMIIDYFRISENSDCL